LSISSWGARKFDKQVTREVEQNHNAHEAGRFNKKLIDSETLKNIGKNGNQMRMYHYYNTLPWGDNGDRIITTEKYFEYVVEIGKLKMEREQFVEQFMQEYQQEKENSRTRLGSLYNENDYPHEFDVKEKFNIRVNFMPIAESDDLRVNLNDDLVNSMREKITSELNNRITVAANSMIERVREAVNHMAEVLSEEGKVFRDTLVGNLQSLHETLPLLNFNDDPRVKDVLDMTKPLLVNPDQLRNVPAFRKEIADRAKKVLETLNQ